ncbi:hypothetical protein EDD15DRAFT_2109145, partial [Pisolithus albus]
EFEHRCHVDIVDEEGCFLPGVLQIGIDDRFLDLQAELDEEYARLAQDRCELQTLTFPRMDSLTPHYMPVNLHRIITFLTPHYMPVNLHRIIRNAIQILHHGRHMPSSLGPVYIIDTVHQLTGRLPAV